jgi:hypothetical protein
MPDPKAKIRINEGTLRELVLNGPEANVTAVRGNIEQAFKRLKVRLPRALKGVEPFKNARPYVGGRPNHHDVRRWTEAVTREEKYQDDLVFMKRIYVTILNRDFSSREV